MGNTTNPDKWDARQRLTFIEEAAFWRGWVLRSDLADRFGLSLPQASADLKAYLALNPGALQYDLSAKRYWGAEKMELRYATPDLTRAIGQLLGPEAKGLPTGDHFATIDLPSRALPLAAARHLFRAISQQLRVRVHYYALTSGRAHWRWISPHAFAHDGYRWHVRAYCHEEGSYKDFVIGRIEASEPPVAGEPPPIPDVDWSTWEKIPLRPHRGLDANQRHAVELDYRMQRGRTTLCVRRAMREYTLAYLRLSTEERFPQHLELAVPVNRRSG